MSRKVSVCSKEPLKYTMSTRKRYVQHHSEDRRRMKNGGTSNSSTVSSSDWQNYRRYLCVDDRNYPVFFATSLVREIHNTSGVTNKTYNRYVFLHTHLLIHVSSG